MNAMKAPQQFSKGFTLIEVMIVVAVIGVLSAIAYPSYTAYILRSHRAEAKNYLQSVAQRLEQNYSLSGAYNTTQAGGAVNNAFVAGTGFGSVPAGGSTRYTITFVAGQPTAGTFTLQAVPAGAQANDACGTLLLDHRNVKGAGGVLNNRAALTVDCWGR